MSDHSKTPAPRRLAPPECNGVPPASYVDPLVRRLATNRGDWERAIRDHVPMDPTVGYVAMMLATYTDHSTGENAHPGEALLAKATGRSTRTVRNALAWLDEHGFIIRTARGSRSPNPRWADAYRLSLPAPLAITLDRWDEEQNGGAWMERSQVTKGVKPRDCGPTSQATHRQHVA